MTGEPIRQRREPLDAFRHRQHGFGGRNPLRNESVDLLSQGRRRARHELPETPLHPSSFGDRHERIGAIGHQRRILACRSRRGDIEAAAERRPCRGNVAAAEMAVNDESEHRSLWRRPRAIGKPGVPKRNGGGEIALQRRKQGVTDHRIGDRFGRGSVSRRDGGDPIGDGAPIDGHLPFPEEHPRISVSLPGGRVDPLLEGGGLVENVERIDPLRHDLTPVGHQISRHRPSS